MKIIDKTASGSKAGKRWLVLAIATLFAVVINHNAMAQQKQQMVRLAKIKVDAALLDQYNAALKLQMTTAVKLEPGVLTYYAVADKKDATQITILEIYADTAAYQAHILTPHFKKYKDTVKDMVKSLELVDVDLIGKATKGNK